MRKALKLVVLGLFLTGCLAPLSYDMYQKATLMEVPTHHERGHQSGWGGVSCIEAQELTEIGTSLMAVVLANEATVTTQISRDFLEWLRAGGEKMLWMMNSSIIVKCQDL